MTDKKKNRSLVKSIVGIAAAVAVVVGIAAVSYINSNRVFSTVSLDVNPSVVIEVNKKEKVIDVIPANEDARVIMGDMDFRGSNIEVAVNALVGSMLRNGYLTDLSNSILISVENDDVKEGEALRRKLSEKVDGMLKADMFEGAVVSQNITATAELEELSEKYSISSGKANLVNEVLAHDSLYTFEDLASLSVNELNLLLEKSPNASGNIETVGKASEKMYMGADNAIGIALNTLGISKRTDVSGLECELDRENGVMVYEIEFYYDGYEYSYDVNAITGDYVLTDKDRDHRSTEQQNTASPATNTSETASPPAQTPAAGDGTYIGMEAAVEKAFVHAGITKEYAQNLRTKFDRDDGRAEYEITFKYDGYEYEYEIDAVSGKMKKAEKDRDDDVFDGDDFDDRPQTVPSQAVTENVTEPQPELTRDEEPPKTVSQPPSGRIDRAAAQDIAFSHVGAQRDGVYDLETELDRDDGVEKYEISFKWDGYEYEYDINAENGSIIKSEKERDD